MNTNLAAFLVTKDRPLQAEFCLHSLYKNLDIARHVDLYILAKYSNQNVKNCYEDIADYYRGKYNTYISISYEKHFGSNFLEHLECLCQHDHCLYITDDTCFPTYSLLTHQELTNNLTLNPNLLTVSLRLGLNTIQQDPEDVLNKLNVPSELMWDWTKEDKNKNTGYPWSMDGHIYRSREFYDFSRKIEFNNLREWEGRIIEWSYDNKPKIPPLMSCFAQSCAVNIPMNFVQPPNLLTQGPYGRSIHELQSLYDLGYRIDLKETFENVQVVGSHQYIDYKFSKQGECR